MNQPDPLRWGIIGAGNIASQQVDDLIADGHSVTAVGSRSPERAAEFAARKGIPRSVGSYVELVTDSDVDIVYVATPVTEHFENAALALRSGKHVLLEKPFTVTAEQAQRLVELADQEDRVLLEALWTRFLPQSRRLREIVSAGVIGDVRAIIADTAQLLPDDPAFRLRRADLGGGALLDLGIYPVSLAFDLLGGPASIVATSTMAPGGLDLQTSLILRYADGAHAYGHSAIDTVGEGGAMILGSRGRIDLDPIFYTATSFTVYDSAGVVVEQCISQERLRGMQYQAREIEQLIKTGRRRSDVLPLEESVAMMRVLDEARRQAGIDWRGSVVL